MSARLHIGRFAERVGRSVHTVRWYEAQGLIPRVGRDSAGRRVFEPDHVEHVLFLERMRQAGMSVADMRRLTELSLEGWKTLDDRRALLRQHRQQIERQMRDLAAALDLIDAKLGYYDQWAANKRRPPPASGAR